ncbi:MAG: hypothetical protein IKL48_05855 [Elusimicrobiaceae bacterium]|nr:hypothetical protein [Elusimicrobiaceae bacterium]
MKKIFLIFLFSLIGVCLRANETQQIQEEKKDPAVVTQSQRKKLFKQRNKEIRKLVKKYRKASAEQKSQIKTRLSEIVSQATDESIAWSKERISAEKENLLQWEKKLQEQEQHLPEVKARRVDEILSGEAERRHKLAKKRWKKELKDRKQRMK